MHCAVPAICLLWGVWGVESKRFHPESRRLCGFSIPLAKVVMKVRYRIWYRDSESVVVVSIFAYDQCGVVLCIIDLHNGDVILQRVLEAFLRQRVCDLPSPDIVLVYYGLRQQRVVLRYFSCVLSGAHYCLLKFQYGVVIFVCPTLCYL